MKYVLLAYIGTPITAGKTVAEQQAMFDECFAFDDQLRANGHFPSGEALQPPDTAVTLRWENGTVVTTDGPFVETKELLGGIGILEAEDMHQVARLMAQHPALKHGTIFEIRPAFDMTGMLKASEQRRRHSTER